MIWKARADQPPLKASPHRGSLWGCAVQSLPFQGRWLGEAETERSYQICSNLSVTFGDSSPERGAFSAAAGFTPQALRASSP